MLFLILLKDHISVYYSQIIKPFVEEQNKCPILQLGVIRTSILTKKLYTLYYDRRNKAAILLVCWGGGGGGGGGGGDI